ncbi:hypothetical protein [Microbacterium sp. NPDC091662]|uniref:hypothetical protein n=1 Tax=Microbacterium sp. NPDC091662 TaxID=3364211 RepID=UPI003830A09D
MTDQTPEQVAAATLAEAGYADWYRPYQEQVAELIAAAVTAERAALAALRDEARAASYAIAESRESESFDDVIDARDAADDVLGRLLGGGTPDAERECDRCGDGVQTLSSRDMCDGCEAEVDGLERCPNCGEFVEPSDMSHWPNLREPVSMCSSCVHNARRSGWEPGA